MAHHLIDFESEAYRGSHITFDKDGGSVLCMHFAGDKTADAVLKSLRLVIYDQPVPEPVAAEEQFEQPPPAWEDTFKSQPSFDGVDPEVSSVVRALDADAAQPAPLPEGPLVSGAEVPSMREMLELMQGKFGPGGEPAN